MMWKLLGAGMSDISSARAPDGVAGNVNLLSRSARSLAHGTSMLSSTCSDRQWNTVSGVVPNFSLMKCCTARWWPGWNGTFTPRLGDRK
jgi:hypothetical protein